MVQKLDAHEPAGTVEVQDHVPETVDGVLDHTLGHGFPLPDLGQVQVAGIDFSVPCQAKWHQLIALTR